MFAFGVVSDLHRFEVHIFCHPFGARLGGVGVLGDHPRLVVGVLRLRVLRPGVVQVLVVILVVVDGPHVDGVLLAAQSAHVEHEHGK